MKLFEHELDVFLLRMGENCLEESEDSFSSQFWEDSLIPGGFSLKANRGFVVLREDSFVCGRIPIESKLKDSRIRTGRIREFLPPIEKPNYSGRDPPYPLL